MVNWRDMRVAELEQQNAELRALTKRQARQLEALLARITKPEEWLRRSSANSSKAPSSDGAKIESEGDAPADEQKAGRAAGTPKHEHPLAPPEQVNERAPWSNHRRASEARVLSGFDAAPRLHHVWELPPVDPHVIEYRVHALGCGGCGHVKRAALPKGGPTRCSARAWKPLRNSPRASIGSVSAPWSSSCATYSVFRCPSARGSIISTR
jgi:transposase